MALIRPAIPMTAGFFHQGVGGVAGGGPDEEGEDVDEDDGGVEEECAGVGFDMCLILDDFRGERYLLDDIEADRNGCGTTRGPAPPRSCSGGAFVGHASGSSTTS